MCKSILMHVHAHKELLGFAGDYSQDYWRLFTRLLEIIHDISRLCFKLYWLLLQPVSEQLEKHLKTLDFAVSREIPLRGQKVIR